MEGTGQKGRKDNGVSCPLCGYTDVHYRKETDTYVCGHCDYSCIPSNIAAINDIRELRAIVPGVTINRGCHRQSETYTEDYIDDGGQERQYPQQGIEDHRFTPMARLFRTIIALNSPLR